MKKILLMVGALLALTAGMAFASGLNLYWDNCGINDTEGGLGKTNKAFGCNVNTGSYSLYASYVAPALAHLAGIEAVIDLQSQGATLPAWWQFQQTGSCRLLSMTVAFITPCLAVENGYARDYWASVPGGPMGNSQYAWGAGGGWPDNRARLKVVCAVDIAQAAPVAEGTEVYAFTVKVLKDLTVAPQTICAGCAIPVCIVWNSCKLAQPTPDHTYILTNAATSQYATWQGGLADCLGATPTTKSTWGQVKALYR